MNNSHVLGIVLATCTLLLSGCSKPVTSTPPSSSTARVTPSRPNATTIEQVRKITAELMGADLAKVNANTSLGDLGADELDFVEIVMELEEHFDINIPDATAEQMMGSQDWKQGMRKVTIEALSRVVDQIRRK